VKVTRKQSPTVAFRSLALSDNCRIGSILAGLGEGPVFRPISRHEHIGAHRLSDHAVAVILKRAAKKAGLSTKQLSGHSLRAGFVTEAKKREADDAAIRALDGTQDKRDDRAIQPTQEAVGEAGESEAWTVTPRARRRGER
jgi:hypothetical protein